MAIGSPGEEYMRRQTQQKKGMQNQGSNMPGSRLGAPTGPTKPATRAPSGNLKRKGVIRSAQNPTGVAEQTKTKQYPTASQALSQQKEDFTKATVTNQTLAERQRERAQQKSDFEREAKAPTLKNPTPVEQKAPTTEPYRPTQGPKSAPRAPKGPPAKADFDREFEANQDVRRPFDKGFEANQDVRRATMRPRQQDKKLTVKDRMGAMKRKLKSFY